MCAHSPTQTQGMRPEVPSFHPPPGATQISPTSPQSRCFFGPEPFPGKDILPVPHGLSFTTCQGRGSLMAHRCLWWLGVCLPKRDTRDRNGRITCSIGYCSGHSLSFYGARFLPVSLQPPSLSSPFLLEVLPNV